MIDNEKCPCAAVAELAKCVELLERRLSENEKLTRENDKKLSNDYTNIALITQQNQQSAEALKEINKKIAELIDERKSTDNDFKKRVRAIVDDVLRWGILLLLAFVAAKIGLS